MNVHVLQYPRIGNFLGRASPHSNEPYGLVNAPGIAFTRAAGGSEGVRPFPARAYVSTVVRTEYEIASSALITQVIHYSFSAPCDTNVVVGIFVGCVAQVCFPCSFEGEGTFFGHSINVRVVFSVGAVNCVSPCFAGLLPFTVNTRRINLIIGLNGFALQVMGVRSSAMVRVFSAISPIRFRFPAVDFRVHDVLLNDDRSRGPQRVRSQYRRAFYVAPVPVRDAVRTVVGGSRIGARVRHVCFFPNRHATSREQDKRDHESLAICRPVNGPQDRLQCVQVVIQ